MQHAAEPEAARAVDVARAVGAVVDHLARFVEIVQQVEADLDDVQVEVRALQRLRLLQHRDLGGDRGVGVGRHARADEAEEVAQHRVAAAGVDADAVDQCAHAGHGLPPGSVNAS